MTTPEQIASDIVSAFAVHNFNLGNGKLEAAPCDELRAAIVKAISREREACAKMVENHPIGQRGGSHHLFADLCDLADAIRNRVTP